jgi:hypothetical protein
LIIWGEKIWASSPILEAREIGAKSQLCDVINNTGHEPILWSEAKWRDICHNISPIQDVKEILAISPIREYKYCES